MLGIKVWKEGKWSEVKWCDVYNKMCDVFLAVIVVVRLFLVLKSLKHLNDYN